MQELAITIAHDVDELVVVKYSVVPRSSEEAMIDALLFLCSVSSARDADPGGVDENYFRNRLLEALKMLTQGSWAGVKELILEDAAQTQQTGGTAADLVIADSLENLANSLPEEEDKN